MLGNRTISCGLYCELLQVLPHLWSLYMKSNVALYPQLRGQCGH